LIRAVALLEASIDFADEEVPVDVTPEVNDLLDGVVYELQKQSDGFKAAERIRSGFEVAIIGKPNVGKSTLFNRLAGRDAAITSEIAGTTRDTIEVRMDIGGMAVTLVDTAGLRETDDAIEALGVERAKERAERSDLRVYLVDRLTENSEHAEGTIVLQAKCDDGSILRGISGKTGAGVDALIERIGSYVAEASSSAGVVVRERQQQALRTAVMHINQAQGVLDTEVDHGELAAEELRSAIRALEMLVGRIDVENVLGEIFSSFCIGK